MDAGEYLKRLQVTKTSLAIEMLSRMYKASKGNSAAQRIPGVHFPEDEIFFLLLLRVRELLIFNYKLIFQS